MMMLATRGILALCLVALRLTNVCGEESASNPRIVIIGAGASGVAAAAKLLENGFTNLTVLEAEDRIGGRVHTVPFGGYMVDLGGQWVHGVEGNVAFNMAWPLGLLEKSNIVDSDTYMYDSSGKLIDQSVAIEMQYFNINYNDSPNRSNSTNTSLGEYLEKEFNEMFKDRPEIMANKAKYLHFLNHHQMSMDAADTWHDVSGKNDEEFWDCDGDLAVNWKDRGYSTILDILMKRYPNPEEEIPVVNHTVLSAEVSLINYTSSENGTSVWITTRNGNTYHADHVIITVSLGVLKERHSSLFDPPLPAWKINSIEGLGFGSVAKIYLEYEKPFWPSQQGSIQFHLFAWSDADKAVFEADPKKKWLLGMSYVLTVEHKPNLLCCWITGEYARAMETLSEEEVFNHTVEHFRKFLGPHYNLTTPVKMLRTRWYSNPHFRGTYSFRSIDSDKRDTWPDKLEEPLSKDKNAIIFAGEATNPHHFGTVNGAIETGWSAADNLINLYSTKGDSVQSANNHRMCHPLCH